MDPVRVGVLGCGAVSRQYLPILMNLADLEVHAVADADAGRARAAAEEHGVPRSLAPDELVSNDAVELVVNLTPITEHFATTRSAIEAGKHVYSEKSLAVRRDEAVRLRELAHRHGVVLACAPDTLLGTGFQAARRAVEAGSIGQPVTAGAFMLRAPLKPPMAPAEVPLPLLDIAPYYLTALINLLGPAQRVTGFFHVANEPGGDAPSERVIGSSVIEFGSAVTASLTLAWGSNYRSEVPMLFVIGTDGVLRAPNPNWFGEAAFIRRHGDLDWSELAGSRQPSAWPRNLRGVGVAEMARAVREGRPPRTAADIAAHVVDIVESVAVAARQGDQVETSTNCAVPAALTADELAFLLRGHPEASRS
jgi:predicted dehydrogenase